MSNYQSFRDRVDEGRLGLNSGFSTGSPNIDKIIQGLVRRTYYLIGGGPGTGKTAFADHSFVLNPYREMLRLLNQNVERKLYLRIFYNSFEVEKVNKIAKWVCYELFLRYGWKFDINFVLSIGKNKISQEVYDKVVEIQDYMEKMEDYVHIMDESTNPTGIYMQVKKYMDANGRVDEHKKIVRGQEIKFRKYTPNNPDEIVLVITDHIGLLRVEKDCHTKKERIDKYSEQSIALRNFYGVSTLAISQFNRELSDMDRRRFAELTPQAEDFKDSGNTFEDAEVVMSIFNPLRYNLSHYGASESMPQGLPIQQFQGRYRPIIVLKTRNGADMKKIHQNFLGEVGHFRDFPSPIMQNHYAQAREYIKFQ